MVLAPAKSKLTFHRYHRSLSTCISFFLLQHPQYPGLLQHWVYLGKKWTKGITRAVGSGCLIRLLIICREFPYNAGHSWKMLQPSVLFPHSTGVCRQELLFSLPLWLSCSLGACSQRSQQKFLMHSCRQTGWWKSWILQDHLRGFSLCTGTQKESTEQHVVKHRMHMKEKIVIAILLPTSHEAFSLKDFFFEFWWK